MDRRQELCREAQQIANNAYAPYSKFRVGAAVLGKEKIYLGTNVENASYGLSLCAERSALAIAIANGETEIQAIAIACIDAKDPDNLRLLTPCGACRQWMAELASKAKIFICQADRDCHTFSLEDLLPNAFELGED